MKSRAVRREELTTSERDAMYELLNEHFEGVTRAGFEADLSAKNWVVMLLDDANRPVGFSTLVQYRTIFKGSPYGVIYSGDTIVAPSHWGSLVLPKIWIQTVRDICAAQGLEFRKPLLPSPRVQAVVALIRQTVPPLEDDRQISGEIEEVARMVASGELLEAAGIA